MSGELLQLNYAGEPRRWLVLSRTTAGRRYELTIGSSGIECTCEAGVHGKTCWHSLSLAQMLVLQGPEALAVAASPADDVAMLAGELQMHVYTSRFQEKKLLMDGRLSPVRVTIGPPRFALGYDLDGVMPGLAPTNATFRLKGKPEFRDAYVAQLDELGPLWVLKALADRRAASGGRDIVLLCFEDVLLRQDVCHRRILADWLAANTGLIVSELVPADLA